MCFSGPRSYLRGPSLAPYWKSHTHDLDFLYMQKQIEFLVVEKDSGLIKYRQRVTLELDKDCFPEKHFEKFMRHTIALFQHCEEEKYKDLVVQFSCHPTKHTTIGRLFPDK